MAGMLNKLWDDVAGGSPPEKGMKQLRKQSSANSVLFRDVPADAAKLKERRFSSGDYERQSETISIKKSQKISMLSIDCPSETPTSVGSTPPNSPSMASPSTYSQEKDKLWRSVFLSGQNKVMRKLGSDKFDKAQDDSPTVYDWVVITALEG